MTAPQDAGKQAAHTAAPWVLIRQDGREASAIATIEPAPETMVEPNYWTVASVNKLRDEWAANARLIAAAPELLAALTNAEAKLDDAIDFIDPDHSASLELVRLLAEIRAAIAAATPPNPDLERAVAQRSETR